MQDLQTAGYVINAKNDTKCWGSCQGLALAIPLTLFVITTPIICCLMCIKSIQKWWRARRQPPPAPTAPSRIPMRNRKNVDEEKEKMLERSVFTAPLVVAMVDEGKRNQGEGEEDGGLPDYEQVENKSLPEYQEVKEDGNPETLSKCDEAQE